MNDIDLLNFYNGECLDINEIPVLDMDKFRTAVIGEVESKARIISLFVQPREEKNFLMGILAQNTGELAILSAPVNDTYPALTPYCHQAHLFEREIAEQWGIVPEGHPWLKPVRFHKSYSTRDAWGRKDQDPILPGVTNYFEVQGEEIHEVAVGPVHAGIIEPGHFCFQCHGENVLHLEISLGFQHRGVEKSLIGGPDKLTIHQMETLAGDTTIGHCTAYAQAVESLAGCNLTARAHSIRGIALELERLANHIGDLGALSGDIGYLPTASFCGRIRGDFLNMTALVCGNRFGRNLIKPGGVNFYIDQTMAEELTTRIQKGLVEVTDAVSLMRLTPSVLARLEDTGVLSKEICEDLGLVGLTARACGLQRDVRFQFPSGIYTMAHIPLSTWETGDAFARAYVRWLEIQKSCNFILEQLKSPPEGKIFKEIGALPPEKLVVSLVEGWRGEICHTAATDKNGRFTHYKIVDPSFHNWMGLAMALRNEQISDFPLCNKSFNLSYCGHDL